MDRYLIVDGDMAHQPIRLQDRPFRERVSHLDIFVLCDAKTIRSRVG